MPSQPIFPLLPWAAGTDQPRLPFNDNMLRLQVAISAALGFADAAPAEPAQFDQHVVGDAWGGFASGSMVVYIEGTWLEFEPFPGLVKTIGADVYRFHDEAWVLAMPGTPLILVSETEPEDPALNQLWLDTST